MSGSHHLIADPVRLLFGKDVIRGLWHGWRIHAHRTAKKEKAIVKVVEDNVSNLSSVRFPLRNSMESGVSSPVTPVVMPEGVISPSAAIGVVIPSGGNK